LRWPFVTFSSIVSFGKVSFILLSDVYLGLRPPFRRPLVEEKVEILARDKESVSLDGVLKYNSGVLGLGVARSKNVVGGSFWGNSWGSKLKEIRREWKEGAQSVSIPLLEKERGMAGGLYKFL
jgi:hypothetical protein